MADKRRILRLQQLILEIVAETIQRELRDPRIGVVSITRVKLSPDLSVARVYWSVLGDEVECRTTQRGLEHALSVLQRAVARGLSTRICPRLALQFDDALEKSIRLEAIFHDIHKENRKRGMEEEEPETGTETGIRSPEPHPGPSTEPEPEPESESESESESDSVHGTSDV